MLENAVVFILSNAKYDAPIESSGYALAKHLAKKNRVFYIEYPSTIKDYFIARDTLNFKKRKNLYRRSSNGLLETENPNLKIVITPLLLSINFVPEGLLYRKLLQLNEKVIVSRIKKIIREYDFKDFIYINSFNIYYPNVGKSLGAKLNVYHCVDPITHRYDAKHGIISEYVLLKDSDVVICTSKELYNTKVKNNVNTYFVPNAADYEHSKKAMQVETKILPALAKISRPIVGYFGNIESRIDFDLLKKVMAINRDKSFVFVGPISNEFREKFGEDNPNLYLVDKIPYKDMPAVLKGFDVAIIPFKKDNLSNTIFPLKLFEYLGSGTPVISTDFNTDLQEFTLTTVPFCKDSIEFSDAINNALKNESNERKMERLRIAQSNTWEKRLNEFSSILKSHLAIN